MRHFLFEDKEYRIRATFKRRRNIPDAAAELARLLRSRGYSGGRRGADMRQKCIAKIQYSSSKKAHEVQLGYLAREGTDIDGGSAKLFGTESEEYKKNMVGRNFRIFLSPQKRGVNLQKLAEQFIAKLEKQTGYRFYWQGACHYNTAHPHAHLLINGVDRYGREVTVPKDVVKTFMRETAQDLCTVQLGKRTLRDLEIEREQELSAPRFTRLDKQIVELCMDGQVKPGWGVHEKDRILARLEALRKLKLCDYENGAYTMKQDWEEDLRANGRYNAFLKARENLSCSDPSRMKVYDGKAGEITGKVTNIYRPDGDASDNHVVVLEGIDGSAWFVPLFRQPETTEGKKKNAAGAGEEAKAERKKLTVGELVTLKAYASQTGRLTPVIFRKDIRQIQNMVKHDAYTGKLAQMILNSNAKMLSRDDQAKI